jgi:hypothetical protein
LSPHAGAQSTRSAPHSFGQLDVLRDAEVRHCPDVL